MTPYDTTHLGHAFTFVQFDTLVRALSWLGREVIYVQNVTDIDDSILIRARKLGVDWQALGDAQTAQYCADMQALNVAEPSHFVRATTAIDVSTSSTASSRRRGLWRTVAACFSGAHPHMANFQTARGDTYRRPADDADVDDPRKEDPLDFALWKGWSGRSDEPCWESPWGRGRPGWHVECSALCYQYLGPSVTLHGGGSDLIYPHHENEIAQSEAATAQRPFVSIWSHTGMVRMDGEDEQESGRAMMSLLLRPAAGPLAIPFADAISAVPLGITIGRSGNGRPPRASRASRRLARRLAAAARAPEARATQARPPPSARVAGGTRRTISRPRANRGPAAGCDGGTSRDLVFAPSWAAFRVPCNCGVMSSRRSVQVMAQPWRKRIAMIS